MSQKGRPRRRKIALPDVRLTVQMAHQPRNRKKTGIQLVLEFWILCKLPRIQARHLGSTIRREFINTADTFVIRMLGDSPRPFPVSEGGALDVTVSSKYATNVPWRHDERPSVLGNCFFFLCFGT